MPQSGTQVIARPSGWDSPQYDGNKEEIEGTLRVEEVEGNAPYPPFTLYTVDGRPVDHTTIKPVETITAAATEPIAAGLAVKALDTGRVLLLQRALTEKDPAAGKWEFPGGHLESDEDPSEGATREWEEETGLKLPAGTWTGAWTSPNGIYKGYVYTINQESDLDINLDHEDRKVLNPDDPDGDEIEVIAWFSPEDLPDNPALRDEVKDTDWTLLASGDLNLEFYNECHSPDTGQFCESLVGDISALSPENQKEVRETIKKIPVDIRSILSKKGIKAVGYAKATQTESGRGLDYGGLYSADKREVQISNKAFDDLDIHNKQGDAHFILHEFGHAVDSSLGYPSKTAAFKVIWKDTEPRKGGYFQKSLSGSDPRQELFAEAFAQEWSGTEHPDFKMTPYLNQIVKELRHNVTTGEEFSVFASITEFHVCDQHDCKTHGNWATGAYRKAYDKARSLLPDDPFQMLPIEEITGHPWLLPNGFPGKGLNTVEQKVTAIGKILHNEIAARLQSQGILRPDSKEVRAKDEKLRAEMKEGADFMDSLAESGFQTNALDRFKEKFPDMRWQDGTSEQREAVFKDIDKEFPGYLKAKKALEAYPAYGRELQDFERTYTLAYRAEALRVLSEVHGGAFGNEDIAVRKVGSTNNKAMDTVRRAGQVYPDAWVIDANHNGVVMVKPGSRGLHKWEEVSKIDSKGYVKGPDGKIIKIRTSTITVDKVPGYRGIDKSEYYPTAVHEVGHRFEQTRPHIMALEWAFWARRAGKEKPQPLRKLSPDRSYKADEMAVQDRFEDPYMGKIYRESPREPFESFTMGMQGMFGGSYRMWHDSDYASFILGILAAG